MVRTVTFTTGEIETELITRIEAELGLDCDDFDVSVEFSQTSTGTVARVTFADAGTPRPASMSPIETCLKSSS